jgi:ABC-2 type transport system permease protein
LGAVEVLVVYELRRVLAKKRVLVLIAAVFLMEAGLYLVVTRLPPSFLGPTSSYVWMLGIVAPTLGLLQVTSLMVGSTVFSDEYEAGTSDFWMTRPISRTEYYIGKVLGGLALVLIIISAYTAFSVSIAWSVFGPQQRLDLLVTSLPASVASSLPFYAIGLAFGEALRRGILATVLSGLTFFGSYIFEGYANIVAALSDDRALLELSQLLPTWGSTRITTDVLVQGLTSSGLPSTGILSFLARSSGGSSPSLMLLNVAAYTAIALLLAWLRLRTSDVTRRAQ